MALRTHCWCTSSCVPTEVPGTWDPVPPVPSCGPHISLNNIPADLRRTFWERQVRIGQAEKQGLALCPEGDVRASDTPPLPHRASIGPAKALVKSRTLPPPNELTNTLFTGSFWWGWEEPPKRSSRLRPHHSLGPVEAVGDGSRGAGNGAQEGRRVPGQLLHGVF